MALFDDLTRQMQEKTRLRDQTRQQFQDASIPVTSDDATRYLTEKAGGFAPLQQERRQLMAQAAETLPTQMQEYIQQKNAGMQGPSSLNALTSMFRNQQNVRQSANLLGDQVETARGNLGQIANSALQNLGQRQSAMQTMMGQYDSDINSLLGQIESERSRRAASAAQAAQMAAMYGSQDQGMVDPGSNELEKDPEKPGFFKNTVDLVGKYANAARSNPTINKLIPYSAAISPIGALALRYGGDNKPIYQNISEDANKLFARFQKK